MMILNRLFSLMHLFYLATGDAGLAVRNNARSPGCCLCNGNIVLLFVGLDALLLPDQVFAPRASLAAIVRAQDAERVSLLLIVAARRR